jgi:hypothetical protein
MKWNAFSLISPSIERTKKRLFPFQFWEWFRLMIIVALAANKSAGNFNYNSSGRGDSNSIKSFSEFSDKLREVLKKYWVFGTGIFIIGFILMTIFSYIQSVFSFIFIDALVEKKAKFTFRKNNSKGVSLFMFKFLISILTIITIAGLAFPYIYNFMKGNPILASTGLGYITLSITAAIIYFLLLWILFLFIYDFAVPYMYSKNTSTWFSLKKIWDEIGKNKLETLIYWVARLVVGIVIGIIGILIAVLILIAFILVGLLIFLIGFGLYKIIGAHLFLIILGIIIGIILFIIFLLTVGMVLLPINVFFRYFQLISFENLTKIKILKK